MSKIDHLNGRLEFVDTTVKNRYNRLNMGLHFPFSVRSQVECKTLRAPGERVTIPTGIIIPQEMAERLQWTPTPHLFKGSYQIQLSPEFELLLIATHGSRHSQQFRQNDLLGKLTLKAFNPWTDGKEQTNV